MRAWLSVVIATIILAGCSQDLQGTKSFDPGATPALAPLSGGNNLKGNVARTEFAELVRRSVATSPTTAAGAAVTTTVAATAAIAMIPVALAVATPEPSGTRATRGSPATAATLAHREDDQAGHAADRS